jgi:hypothetical protein
LKLGEGLSPDQTHIAVSGRIATLTFGDGSDQITLELGPRGPVTVAFADGSTVEIKPETQDPSSAPAATVL